MILKQGNESPDSLNVTSVVVANFQSAVSEMVSENIVLFLERRIINRKL
jgi:hypothetical protein